MTMEMAPADLTDKELNQKIDAAYERLRSALDIYREVPLGPLSDAALEQALDSRYAVFKELLAEKWRRTS